VNQEGTLQANKAASADGPSTDRSASFEKDLTPSNKIVASTIKKLWLQPMHFVRLEICIHHFDWLKKFLLRNCNVITLHQ
jgi:hypothetical protein